MEQICQLSKSVSCPPQALAYQAHLSLSCPCLLISVCISLSLPPEGKDSRTDTECKSHSGFYTLPPANTWGKKTKKREREREKRVKEGQSERDESKQNHETEKPTKGQDDYFNLLESKNSLRWRPPKKKKTNTHHQRDSSHNIGLPWSQRDQLRLV